MVPLSKTVVALAALVASAAAHAVLPPIGEIETNGGASNNTFASAQGLGSLGVSDVLTVNGSRVDAWAGSYSVDFYSFTLTSSALLSLGVNVKTVATGGSEDSYLGLFNSAHTLIVANDDISYPTNLNSFLTASLSAGTYYVGVTGCSGSCDIDFLAGTAKPGGGVYDGYSSNWKYTLTAQTAPVPEPETYAMMLAGLGALGFMARRRRLQ